MLTRAFPILVGLAVLALGACGRVGSPGVAPRPSTSPLSPTPGPSASAVPVADPVAVAARGLEATRALRTMRYDAETYCRGNAGPKPKKLKPLSDGTYEVTTTTEVRFKGPERYRLAITRCTNPDAVGIKVALSGTQAEVRLKGLLGAITFRRSVNDAELKDLRGHTLLQASPLSIARHWAGLAPGAMSPDGELLLDGIRLVVLASTQRLAHDPRITRARVGYDPASGLPRWQGLYEGERLVSEMRLRHLQPNASLSESDLAI